MRAADAAKAALILSILVYGAALRLVGITEIFGPVAQPHWLGATQRWAAASLYRPDGLRWEPAGLYPHRAGPPTRYQSDPYTYLQYAREMRSFYAAHRREPLFPFVTKLSLWMLSDQDVAVSFASAAFSVLAIAATFLAGAVAFGFWVGAGAAALVAIEYDLISWGVAGWRDDAFMCGVLLVSAALLWLLRSGDWRTGIALGVVGGGACLVRITSLSFLIPALAVVLLLPGGDRRGRLRAASLAAAIAAILIAPYLVNCWRVYGDPLYSINVHASVYQETEGRPGDPSLTARAFLRDQFERRPLRTIDTVLQGLTVYPFASKWSGYHVWHPRAGNWLSVAAIAGLILFAGSLAGRVLLLVLGSSLVPYAATWRLIADWRFTEHAYPFFLIAASLAVAACVRGLVALRTSDAARLRAARPAALWVVGAATLAIVTWLLTARVLPVAVMNETLAAGEPATIMALDRDGAFFSSDWAPGPGGGIPTRITAAPRAVVHVPMPAAAAYEILLRVDALFERQAGALDGTIQLLLNGRLLARCDPGTTPDRVGTCRVRVPAESVRPGMNRLMLVTDRERGRGFRLWYVRVAPGPG